jgi:chitinase
MEYFLFKKWVIEYLLSEQVPPKKIVLGFPAYGRTLLMANANQSNIYDPATGSGSPGTYTQTEGYLAYYEVIHSLIT